MLISCNLLVHAYSLSCISTEKHRKHFCLFVNSNGFLYLFHFINVFPTNGSAKAYTWHDYILLDSVKLNPTFCISALHKATLQLFPEVQKPCACVWGPNAWYISASLLFTLLLLLQFICAWKFLICNDVLLFVWILEVLLHNQKQHEMRRISVLLWCFWVLRLSPGSK